MPEPPVPDRGPVTTAEPVHRPTGRALAAVVAAFLTHGLVFASWTAHVPHVKADLGLSDGTLGLALLGVPAGAVSSMLVSAALLPRLGSRVMVRACLVGYCLAGPLVGLAGSVWELFGALFVWGAFQGMLDVSMNTQAITVEKVRGRPIMNGMHACWSFGAFAGAGIGTVAVANGVDLTPQLLGLGLASLAVAGWLSVAMLPDLVDDTQSGGPAPRRWPRFSLVMLALGAVAFASMLVEGGASDWSSVYLRDSLGAGAGIAGLGYTVFAAAEVLVRLSGNRLIARFGTVRTVASLAGLATVAYGAALAIGAVPTSVAGLFVLGLGVGTVVPTAFSAAGRLPGVHPGVGVAVVSGLGWAGFVVGPPLIGQLADLTSLPAALVVLPVLTAAITLGARRLRTDDSNTT
jgi:MFS family permease